MSNVFGTYVAPTDPTGVSWQLRQMQGTEGVKAPTGTGTLAGTGTTPDTGAVPGLNAIMESVLALTPKMTGDQLDVLVVSLTNKMKDSIDASERDKIKTDTDAKKIAIGEKKHKLEEAQKKIDEAIERMKHVSIWDRIGMAFGFLAALLTMVMAVVMMATMPGVGMVLGGMLFGAGLMMMTMSVDQATEQGMKDSGKGQFGMFGMMCLAIAKSEGKSDDEADAIATKGQMGARIALMGASILLSLPAMVANIVPAVIGAVEEIPAIVAMAAELAMMVAELAANAAEVASGAAEAMEMGMALARAVEMAQEFAQAAKSVKDAAQAVEAANQAASTINEVGSTGEAMEKVFDLMMQGQKYMDTAVQIVDSTTQVGSAVTSIGSSVETYKATGYQADAKKLQAEAKVFEAMQNMLDDAIDQAMARLKGSGERFNAMLDSITDAVKDRGDTLFHAHFRA